MAGRYLCAKSLAAAVAATLLQLVMLANPAAALEVEPLVSVEWLANHVDGNKILILDLRPNQTGSSDENYSSGHIPGAISSVFPGKWQTRRGNITGALPTVAKLEATLSELGVQENQPVVLVPAGTSIQDLAAATRVYWTFKFLGHDNVSVLDGGHAAWVQSGRPLEKHAVEPKKSAFQAEPRPELYLSTDEVASFLREDIVLLDSRSHLHFQGLEKHDDAIRFGHLPGATHFDPALTYDPDGNKLKPRRHLSAMAEDIVSDKNAPIIAYSNTGRLAALNWFVLTELLGYQTVAVYDDGIIGWSRHRDLPLLSTEVVTN